jgi:DUF2934 family protein
MSKSRRTKKAVATTSTQTALTVVENHNEASTEAVAARAYQLYIERGCTHGHDLDDWIEAERQIKTESQQTNDFSMARRVAEA